MEKKGKKAGLKAGLINNINTRDFGKIQNFVFLQNFGFLDFLEMEEKNNCYYLLTLVIIIPIFNTLISLLLALLLIVP